jgi:4-hydroxy-2-oxoglutarate aldolase
MLIDGIHLPLTAPFKCDGENYLHKLEYNVGRYSLGPAAGMVALTSSCEGATLSDDEIRETLLVISKTATKEKVLVAAIAKESVRGSLGIAEEAAAAGFDAVFLSAPPQWQRLSRPEVLLFFRTVADRSPLPVMLSSETAAPGFQLSVDEIEDLSRHWNVIGLYDSGLTLEKYRSIAAATKDVKRDVNVTPVFAPVTRRMQKLGDAEAAPPVSFVPAESLAGGKALSMAPHAPPLKTRVKSVGFQVMVAGSTNNFVELLEAGVAGGMLTLSACAPQGCHEAYAAFKDGDPALAAEKGHRLFDAAATISALGIAGVKYGCDLNGYYGGSPRLPGLPLRTEDRKLVERVLAGLRN